MRPGARSCETMVAFAIKKFSFEPDEFVHELVDSIVGDMYPVPDRMLVHNERIVHEYLMWAMCGGKPPAGKFDLYAVEGGTAAMCYVFKSLMANRILEKGDTIALGTPIFTPYLEMPHLEDYDLEIVNIESAAGRPLPVQRRRDRQAREPQGQDVLPRQPGQSLVVGRQQGRHRQDREAREDEAAGSARPDRRRLRHVRRRASDRSWPTCPTTRSGCIRSRSTSAAPAGASASSPSTRRTPSTR